MTSSSGESASVPRDGADGARSGAGAGGRGGWFSRLLGPGVAEFLSGGWSAEREEDGGDGTKESFTVESDEYKELFLDPAVREMRQRLRSERAEREAARGNAQHGGTGDAAGARSDAGGISRRLHNGG